MSKKYVLWLVLKGFFRTIHDKVWSRSGPLTSWTWTQTFGVRSGPDLGLPGPGPDFGQSKHHHQQLHLYELSTSMCQDGTPHSTKKCPKNGSYCCLVLRYALYECHDTTNHHNQQQLGAQDLSQTLMYAFSCFISFFSILT